MTAGSGKCQHKQIILDPIDEQPVRLYMTFTVSYPISSQGMIFVLLWKPFAVCQLADDVIEEVDLQAALHRQCIVFLELVSPNDV